MALYRLENYPNVVTLKYVSAIGEFKLIKKFELVKLALVLIYRNLGNS